MIFVRQYLSGEVVDLNSILEELTDESVCQHLAYLSLTRNNVFDAMMLLSHPSFSSHSFLFELIESEQGFEALLNSYKYYFSSKRISLELKYVVYMSIVRSYFLGKDIDRSILINIFKIITNYVYDTLSSTIETKRHISNSIPLIGIDVWILTGQFLTTQHGPTLTALTIANELSLLGLNVGIVCTNSFAFDRFKYSDKAFIGNHIPEYSTDIDFDIEINCIHSQDIGRGYSTIKYKDNSYVYVSIDGNFLNKFSTLSNTLNSDSKIISVGDSNIYSDWIARHKNVYNIPCSFELPLVNFEYPSICRKLEKKEVDTCDLYKHKIIETRFPYATRFNNNLKNKDKDKDKDINVIMIGSRLTQELCDKTLNRMSCIYKNFPSVKFNFIGIKYENTIIEKFNSVSIPSSCAVFHGFITNVEDFILSSDFYLNPMRRGGGTSVLESLSLQVPPICFPYGDGFHTAGEYFSFDSDNNVISFMKRHLKDPTESLVKCHTTYLLNTNVRKVISEITRYKIIA